MKRKRQTEERDGENGEDQSTPKKTRSTRKSLQNPNLNGNPETIVTPKGAKHLRNVVFSEDEEEVAELDTEADGSEGPAQDDANQTTPLRVSAKAHLNGNETPRSNLRGKKLFSTPRTSKTDASGTPRIERNANRSARRKSTRNLIERTVLGITSDNEDDDGELANHIYGSEDDEANAGEEEIEEEALSDGGAVQETPSKKRGRPKGRKTRARSPSPLTQDLPPHEKYFVQNRPGKPKTSNNTLAALKLLDHEEYFSITRNITDNHAASIKELSDLHEQSFKQWQFELAQDFNICLYGWGSKRSLLMKFAHHVYNAQQDHTKEKIVVVNGYVPTLTIRDVLNTVAVAVAEPGVKLGSQPAEMLERLFLLVEEDDAREVTIIIHSIDRLPLRRPTTQVLLSRLSAHPQIRIIASADHPSFPLLWDNSLRSTYNFLFHQCTTFKPYNAEVDVVDEVHELLGRSGRRVGGKDGVIFVLKSLPVNATNLFQILIAEQLATMGDGPVIANDNDDDDEDDERHERARKGEEGVEYRVLYQKAVEEFICSNDMGFRSLLKEFHDHQMIQKKRDLLGTEYLFVPFRKEELESILEDISA